MFPLMYQRSLTTCLFLLATVLWAGGCQAPASPAEGSTAADTSVYQLQVTRAPFSYAIRTAGGQVLLAESRTDTARSALFFITEAGPQYLTEPGQFSLEGNHLEARYGTTDGREARIEIAPAPHGGWRVALSFEPSEGILQVGETLAARPGEHFHGLTERVRGNDDDVPRDPGLPVKLGRRGHFVKMDVNGTISLYAPFYLSSAGYGLYVETTWLGTFDMARRDAERVCFAFQGPSLTYHLFPGSPERILERYTATVGRPLLPPRWAFGVYRWRDTHVNRDTLYDGTPYRGPINAMIYEDVVMMDRLDIPLDVYWVDRPWAEGPLGFSDYAWDRKRLPRPEAMIDWLNNRGHKFLLWIGPWVQGEMAAEALQNGYFLPSKGMARMGLKRAEQAQDLDFLRALKPAMIEQIKNNTDLRRAGRTFLGVERASASSDAEIRTALIRLVQEADTLGELRRLLPVGDRGFVLVDYTNPEAVDWWQHHLTETVLEDGVAAFKLDRAEEFVPDARDVYAHDGRSMAELQNVYPTLYTKATFEAVNAHRGKDYVLMPRAGWPGSQQYAVFWSGDPDASFLGLRNAYIGGLRAGLMGYPLWGSDTGGYGGTPTHELFARWLALSAFSPIMEVGPLDDAAPWDMPAGTGYNVEAIATFRLYAKLHKHLQDYIYRYAREARETGHPIMHPLFYEHPDDEKAWTTWDEYYFGEAYLVAPVLEEGAREREVYLPKGRWIDYWNPEHEITGPTTVTVETPLYKTPIFLRAGSDQEILDLDALYQESLDIAQSHPDLPDGSDLTLDTP